MKKLLEYLKPCKKAYDSVVCALSNKEKPYYIQNIIAAFVIAFFATTALFMKVGEYEYFATEYVASKSILFFCFDMILFFAIQMILSKYVFRPETVLSVSGVLTLTVFCAFLQKGSETNIWLNVGIALVCLIFCIWLFNRFESPLSSCKINFKFVKIAVGIMFLVFTTYLSIMGVCRYYSFTYDTFDFGIFAQMFDYMKQTGLPDTTVERNMLLSHFAVHFSPFFYLLLPGYFVFSTPAYLCVMQTLFVGAGVFLVYGIAKHLGFSPKQTLAICSVYLTYPALSFGLFFDFHENKFLTFFILLTVYFLLKKKYIPFYISAVLLCSIKEDAAIYLVAIALYMIASQRLIKHGIITLVLAVGYFVFAMSIKPAFGTLEDMQFVHRYSNYAIDNQSSLVNIIKTVFLNFGYTVSQMFTAEKFEFVLWMFLPILFMPLFTKKVSTLLLLTPMLLINLMTNWVYQYHIDFQYTFGSAALIIICSILSIKNLSAKNKKIVLCSMVMISLAITMPRVITRCNGYIGDCFENKQVYKSSIKLIDETLEKDKVIGVEGIVMPMLYDYPNLYLDPHSDELAAKVEYFVAKSDDKEDIQTMVDKGFVLVTSNNHISIYKNSKYVKAK